MDVLSLASLQLVDIPIEQINISSNIVSNLLKVKKIKRSEITSENDANFSAPKWSGYLKYYINYHHQGQQFKTGMALSHLMWCSEGSIIGKKINIPLLISTLLVECWRSHLKSQNQCIISYVQVAFTSLPKILIIISSVTTMYINMINLLGLLQNDNQVCSLYTSTD